MTPLATLRRRSHLITLVEAPYHYPDKSELITRLTEAGFDAVSERTLQRDIRDLYNEFGVRIAYDRKRNGYCLDLPADEDLSDFRQFLRLMELRERLAFLNLPTTELRAISRYVQVEHNRQFRGAEYLPILWEAVKSRRAVQFHYHPYDAVVHRQRLVEPHLLFEYRNRWYLDAWEPAVNETNKMRTFGLDRMSQLNLTTHTIPHDRAEEFRAYRQHAIGVTCPPGQAVERVVLRFTGPQRHYVESLPLHSTQTPLVRTSDSLTVTLQVILNPELEREILGFGADVEVLEPIELRKEVTKRIKAMAAQYARSEEAMPVSDS